MAISILIANSLLISNLVLMSFDIGDPWAWIYIVLSSTLFASYGIVKADEREKDVRKTD